MGVLVGLVVSTLHQVYHALTHQIPENIHAHVFGELAASTLGGAALFAAVSATCNRLARTR